MARRNLMQALTHEQIAELPTHPNLQFLNETNERTRQRYLSTLYNLRNREIDVPYTLDWGVAESTGLAESINPFLTYVYQDTQGIPRITCNAWRNLFHIEEQIYRELVLEFFSTVQFDPTEENFTAPCFTFRLGGAAHGISIRELAWRMGLYTQAQTRSQHFIPFLNSLIISTPDEYDEPGFWREISGRGYQPSEAKERMLHSPIHRLLHRLLANTLTHKTGSDKVPTTDLFYLWTLITPGRHLNLPHAIALFLSRKGAGGRTGSAITGGHLVTRLAASYSLTTRERLRGMMTFPIRKLGAHQLEGMTILTRLEDGTYQIPDAVQPAAGIADPLPQPQPQPRPRRRRVRSPAQQQGPEPEVDIRYLADQVREIQLQNQGMQVQMQWLGSNMTQFFEYQGFQPQHPFPSPYPPYPTWYTPGPTDGAGTSGTHHDDDDEDE